MNIYENARFFDDTLCGAVGLAEQAREFPDSNAVALNNPNNELQYIPPVLSESFDSFAPTTATGWQGDMGTGFVLHDGGMAVNNAENVVLVAHTTWHDVYPATTVVGVNRSDAQLPKIETYISIQGVTEGFVPQDLGALTHISGAANEAVMALYGVARNPVLPARTEDAYEWLE